MTVEWLEEQLAKRIEENERLQAEADRLNGEIEELKDVIHELLPIDENDKCAGCRFFGSPDETGYHTGVDFRCFSQEFFAKARKVLGL